MVCIWWKRLGRRASSLEHTSSTNWQMCMLSVMYSKTSPFCFFSSRSVSFNHALRNTSEFTQQMRRTSVTKVHVNERYSRWRRRVPLYRMSKRNVAKACTCKLLLICHLQWYAAENLYRDAPQAIAHCTAGNNGSGLSDSGRCRDEVTRTARMWSTISILRVQFVSLDLRWSQRVSHWNNRDRGCLHLSNRSLMISIAWRTRSMVKDWIPSRLILADKWRERATSPSMFHSTNSVWQPFECFRSTCFLRRWEKRCFHWR